jgi:hypothetical protein
VFLGVVGPVQARMRSANFASDYLRPGFYYCVSISEESLLRDILKTLLSDLVIS